jgi:hypothetical protein
MIAERDRFMRYDKIICKDGFSMSVQAGYGLYSSPRLDSTIYTEVEVGFPNKIEPLLMPYCEDSTIPSKTVYGYVPVEVVTTVIVKHGGIVSGNAPPGVIDIRAVQEINSKMKEN